MKIRICTMILVLGFLVQAVSARPPQLEKTVTPPPPWAYGFESPADSSAGAPASVSFAPPPIADDGSVKHLPGSTRSFTIKQVRDPYNPPDWYPDDHPDMPEIVAHGRKPEVFACSLCHYPNGKGRPENAGIAGLPYEYFVQTMADFRNGARRSADARKSNTYMMAGFAHSMTDEEIKAVATYFSGMKWTPWIQVVETNAVPKTHISGGMFLRVEGDATEPIGQRIIETPENTEATEKLGDSRSAFIAFVPVGSLKKGEALVMNGGAGKTTRCTICHGEDLQGLGPVPGIAGRSPSYVMRQLVDMQSGSRSGVWTNLMKPVLAKLTIDDMIAITAYLASRRVGSESKTTGTNLSEPNDKKLLNVHR